MKVGAIIKKRKVFGKEKKYKDKKIKDNILKDEKVIKKGWRNSTIKKVKKGEGNEKENK